MRGSAGLVVENERQPGDLDEFEWYCFGCSAPLHRIEIAVADIGKNLPPLFSAFYADAVSHTCKRCGTLHSGNEPTAGRAVILDYEESLPTIDGCRFRPLV